MPLIPLLGTSRAGKTTVSRRLVEAPVSYDLDSLRLLDTDEELGPSHRSNAQRAIALLQRNNTEDEVVLADCGAGLIAFNEGFRQFLTAHPDYPRNLIVVWCDESTFRSRRSKETVQTELLTHIHHIGPQDCLPESM